MALSKAERDALPEHDFAVPRTRQLPIHDERHVKMAWSQLSRTAGLSDAERKEARRRILNRAHDLGIDTAGWELHAVTFEMQAMALEMPAGEHPNKMPFTGILTRVDQPSDKPPGGATGKRVYIPSKVAEAALGTLLGMGVDCTPNFDGHDAQFKIGLITEAFVKGNAVHIAGFLYADDFPEECARIQKEKSRLGFSYECKVAISDMNADPWVVDRIVFTGAAVLYKSKAAYETTSLAASAEVTEMEIKDILDAVGKVSAAVEKIAATQVEQGKELVALKAKGASLAGPIIDQAMPHVGACNAAADAMEAAGIGTHPTMGHAAMLRHVGAHILHAATMGKLPQIFNDHSYFGEGMRAAADPAAKAEAEKQAAELKAAQDAIASLKTEIADLKAAAAKGGGAGAGAGAGSGTGDPQRRSLPAGAALLDKFGLKPNEDSSISIGVLDKALEAAGIKGTKAIETKLQLRSQGIAITA